MNGDARKVSTAVRKSCVSFVVFSGMCDGVVSSPGSRSLVEPEQHAAENGGQQQIGIGVGSGDAVLDAGRRTVLSGMRIAVPR
jgi:hypothetical protein